MTAAQAKAASTVPLPTAPSVMMKINVVILTHALVAVVSDKKRKRTKPAMIEILAPPTIAVSVACALAFPGLTQLARVKSYSIIDLVFGPRHLCTVVK